MTQTPLDYETPQPRKRWLFPKFTLPELLVIVFIIAVLVAILLPALNTGHPASPSVKCLSQLRMIGVALMQYAQQNQGVYPARVVDVCHLKMPPELFTCPTSKTETRAAAGASPQQTINNLLAGSHVTYVYLGAGKNIKNFRGSQTVLAYEPAANHGTKTTYFNVLFGDGHAASMPGNLLAQMIQELNAGQNPPPALAGR